MPKHQINEENSPNLDPFAYEWITWELPMITNGHPFGFLSIQPQNLTKTSPISIIFVL